MMRLRVRLCEPDGTVVRWLPAKRARWADQENGPAELSFQLSTRAVGYLVEVPFVVEVGYSVDGGRFQQFDRNNVFLMDEDSGDDAENAKDVTFRGQTYVFDSLPQHWVMENERTKDGQREFRGPGGAALSAGAILREELDESKGAGWAPHVVLGFTGTHDSEGVAWAAEDKRAFSMPVPSDQGRLVSALIDQGMCEVESRGLTFRALRPGTTRDRSHVVLGSTGFTKVPVRTSAKGRYTRLNVFYDGGRFALTVPGADTRFGVIDTLLTLNGVTDHASAMASAQAHLAQAGQKREEAYEWEPTEGGWVPGRDFRVGDTVTARARGGDRQRRVIGLVIDDSGTVANARAVVGERVGQDSFAKKLGSLAVGNTIGGSGAAFTPSQPAPVSPPAAPLGLHTVSNTAHWTDDGTARAVVELDWAAVTAAVDGTEATVDQYEVASRLPSDALSQVTTTATTGVVIDTFEPGVMRLVAVRAHSVRGGWGAWSLELPVTPAVPLSIVPKAPTGLAVASNSGSFNSFGLGIATVTVTWVPVLLSVDDEPVTVAEYEVTVGGVTQRVTSASASFTVPSGEMVPVTVAARTNLGVWGDPSAVLAVTGASPTHVTTAPAAPTLTTGGGGVFIHWDGTIPGNPPGVQGVFAEARVDGGAWARVSAPLSTGAGQVPGQVRAAVGAAVEARLRWVDTLGRVSSASATASIGVAGVAMVDLDDAVTSFLDDLDEKAGMAVISAQDEYATSASSSTPPTTGWSTTTPSWSTTNFIWRRVRTFYADETESVSDPVVLTGNPGPQGAPGSDGAPGAPGSDGANITSVTRFYYLTSGSQPAKPTTLTPSAPWSTTEPGYNPANPTDSLYATDRVVLSNGSFFYSDVSLSASFDAAKSAYVLANNALTSANGKNKVIWATTAATGTAGYTAGDVWFQRSGTTIIGQWEFTTSWQSRTLAHQVIASIDAGKITVGTLDVQNRVSAGSITTPKLLIADLQNYADDASWAGGTSAAVTSGGWIFPTAGTVVPKVESKVGYAVRVNSDASTNRGLYGPVFPVKGGERYRIEFDADFVTDATRGNPLIGLRIRRRSGTYEWPGAQVFPPSVTGPQTVAVEYTIPERPVGGDTEIVSANFQVLSIAKAGASAGQYIEVWNPRITRMTAGEFIVDGDIEGRHITVDTAFADKFYGSEATFGKVSVDHVSPAFGSEIMLNGNVLISTMGATVDTLVGESVAVQQALADQQGVIDGHGNDITTVTGAASAADAKAEQARIEAASASAAAAAEKARLDALNIQVTSAGMRFSRPNADISLNISNDEIAIEQQGVATPRSVWNKDELFVPQLRANQAVFGIGLIEGGPGRFTIREVTE